MNDGIYYKTLRLLKKDLIEAALYKYRGNVVKAARHLGITRPTLYDHARQVGVKIPGYRRKKS